ncbi:hypothetical protein AK812_SmicGene43107 [Symbiodinium microadriaticum]|uniref:Uncharacterized protein n=1 Tax=Symbiodinium microadriaticum TaxID=2951 RepID=A0A1Q9C1W3_SYMMI|nr:hypothetical protein AK812_SmicGene43107 [Symbiodinium microadriaticum]
MPQSLAGEADGVTSQLCSKRLQHWKTVRIIPTLRVDHENLACRWSTWIILPPGEAAAGAVRAMTSHLHRDGAFNARRLRRQVAVVSLGSSARRPRGVRGGALASQVSLLANLVGQTCHLMGDAENLLACFNARGSGVPLV